MVIINSLAKAVRLQGHRDHGADQALVIRSDPIRDLHHILANTGRLQIALATTRHGIKDDQRPGCEATDESDSASSSEGVQSIITARSAASLRDLKLRSS